MEKRRVMIVDDEEQFLKILKINLEKTGKYEVETMSDASGIVSRVKAFIPDVILLDILMPKTNGAEACRMLSEDPTGKRVPIIAHSIVDMDELMMHDLGIRDFLTKPAEKDDLIAKIEKVLQCK